MCEQVDARDKLHGIIFDSTLSFPLLFNNIPCEVTQYCAGGKIEKNEMGGSCGAYEGGGRCAQGFGGEA